MKLDTVGFMPNGDGSLAQRFTRAEWAQRTTARCARCGEEKPFDQFHRLSSGHHARPVAYHCIPCKSEVAAEWYKNNRGATARKHQLKKMFGLTLEQYDEMVRAQDNRCAICKRTQDEVDPHKKFLPVDHNHATGKVRELLCTLCNQALGLFAEDLDRMRAAITYLERHEESA